MREVSRRIREEESLVGVEGAIASVRDVFALAGNWELEEAERRYLGPAARRRPAPSSSPPRAAPRWAR